jgi:hypothetical protein
MNTYPQQQEWLQKAELQGNKSGLGVRLRNVIRHWFDSGVQLPVSLDIARKTRNVGKNSLIALIEIGAVRKKTLTHFNSGAMNCPHCCKPIKLSGSLQIKR